jgi:hypothetical protein
MSLFLCHECYSWITPVDGRCPDCELIVDASVPDPPMQAIRSVIGDVVGLLGEVRVRRKLLPDHGMLYATTNGLYVLPHQLDQETRVTTQPAEPLMWSLASLSWAPLALLRPLLEPFLGKKEQRAVQVAVLRPVALTSADNDHLPELLMDNPGVFFLRRQAIRGWRRRRRHWSIERDQGPPLKLSPESDRNLVHRRLSQLAKAQRWPDHMLDVELDGHAGAA